MKNKILFFAAVFGFLSLLALPARAHDAHHALAQSAPLSGQSLYNLPSSWQAQNGATVKLNSLQGQPVVVAMAYTSCVDMCPLIIRNMMQIEDDLSSPEHPPVRFVLLSFDTTRDTPARLTEFAQERKIDLNHWTLFHGDKKAVQEMAAALGVRYRLNTEGEYDHSNVITLLDAKGVIAFQQIGLQQDSRELEEKIKALLAQ